jgi:glycine/D-amino acid oxidase-like deaminating enzyme
MAASTKEWDLIVIGAGIVGCSAALYAARNGMSVLIVERDTPGSAQSGRNLGFVRQQGRDLRELPLAMAANHLWQEVEKDLGRSVGWFRGGNLVLAVTDEDVVKQTAWHAQAVEYGLDTVLLNPAQTQERLQLLAPGASVRGGMFTATDGRAEPGRATRAFFDAALEAGVQVMLGQVVSRLDHCGGRISGVWTGDKLHRAAIVLCAAGTGSEKLLRKVGYDLPQERIRATVARTRRRPDLHLDPCVSLPLTGVRQDANGAFVLSVAGGEYDVRADSWRYMRTYQSTRKENPGAARLNYWAPLQSILPAWTSATLADIPPTSERVHPEKWRVDQAVAELREFLPAIAELTVESSWAGIIDTLPDVVPVLGSVDRLDGLLVATGFSGHGFGLGPMAGKVIAEMAVGQPSPLDVSGLSPNRFRSTKFSQSRGPRS